MNLTKVVQAAGLSLLMSGCGDKGKIEEVKNEVSSSVTCLREDIQIPRNHLTYLEHDYVQSTLPEFKIKNRGDFPVYKNAVPPHENILGYVQYFFSSVYLGEKNGVNSLYAINKGLGSAFKKIDINIYPENICIHAPMLKYYGLNEQQIREGVYINELSQVVFIRWLEENGIDVPSLLQTREFAFDYDGNSYNALQFIELISDYSSITKGGRDAIRYMDMLLNIELGKGEYDLSKKVLFDVMNILRLEDPSSFKLLTDIFRMIKQNFYNNNMDFDMSKIYSNKHDEIILAMKNLSTIFNAKILRMSGDFLSSAKNQGFEGNTVYKN